MSALPPPHTAATLRKTLYFLQILLVSNIQALHVSNIASRANTNNCKEVLTKNLECPSIGSFPIAGVCDYFARCIQTENGVESEADFCPDGQIFVLNRCVNSHGLDDCPQKSCPLNNYRPSPPSPPKPKPIMVVVEDATRKTETDKGQRTTTTTKRTVRPLILTGNRPVGHQLHPSFYENNVVRIQFTKGTLSISILIASINILSFLMI